MYSRETTTAIFHKELLPSSIQRSRSACPDEQSDGVPYENLAGRTFSPLQGNPSRSLLAGPRSGWVACIESLDGTAPSLAGNRVSEGQHRVAAEIPEACN